MGSKHYDQTGVRRYVRGMLCLLWALGALLAGAMPARPEQRTLDQALVLLAPGVDINGITRAIDLIGGHVTHVFPPATLIAEVPSDMPFQAGVLALYRQTVDEATLAALPGEASRAVRVWNTWLASEASSEALGDLDGLGAELVGDALVAPPPWELEAQYDDPTPSFYQTSEFLIGRVAVSLMLPKSDGSRHPSTEDWIESEQVQMLSELTATLDWCAANEPNAHLTLIYDDGTFAPISTSIELIDRPYSNQYLWITELMTAKGYTGSSYFDQVRQHNNALRKPHKTDWAFTIFVVDSSNDNDNRFSDGYFAYAYLGGPFAVMTYSNNSYGA